MTEFTWSTSLKTSSSMKYHRISTGSPCVADPCEPTYRLTPLGDPWAIKAAHTGVEIGPLRPPPIPQRKNRSCLVPSLFLGCLIFLRFFSLEIPARSFLTLFHATACYGAPKGSQNWTNNERFVSFFFVLFVAVFSEISKISFKT